MSQFAAYNTDDTKAPTGTYPAPPANATITIGSIQTGIDTKIVGSLFCDVAGTLWIEQTFEDPTLGHWDVVAPNPTGTSVGAGVATVINQDAIAPFARVRFKVGGSDSAHLRLFVRTFGMSRG